MTCENPLNVNKLAMFKGFYEYSLQRLKFDDKIIYIKYLGENRDGYEFNKK